MARRCTPAPRTEFAKTRTEVKPAKGGLPSSVTVQRKSAAPCHLPQGEGYGSFAAEFAEVQIAELHICYSEAQKSAGQSPHFCFHSSIIRIIVAILCLGGAELVQQQTDYKPHCGGAEPPQAYF